MMFRLLVVVALFALAACDRGGADVGAATAHPGAQAKETAAPATAAPPIANSAHMTTRPKPADTEANRAMQRAAEGPRVRLRPCSTQSGAEYTRCVEENKAAIKDVYGEDRAKP